MQRNILEYLENSIVNYPDKVVFSDDKENITYQEFGYRAKRAGCGLAAIMENKRHKPVVVMIDRNIDSIVAYGRCLQW